MISWRGYLARLRPALLLHDLYRSSLAVLVAWALFWSSDPQAWIWALVVVGLALADASVWLYTMVRDGIADGNEAARLREQNRKASREMVFTDDERYAPYVVVDKAVRRIHDDAT